MLRSFDSLSLDDFISAGAVAARCCLKRSAVVTNIYIKSLTKVSLYDTELMGNLCQQNSTVNFQQAPGSPDRVFPYIFRCFLGRAGCP